MKLVTLGGPLWNIFNASNRMKRYRNYILGDFIVFFLSDSDEIAVVFSSANDKYLYLHTSTASAVAMGFVDVTAGTRKTLTRVRVTLQKKLVCNMLFDH